MYSIQHHLRHGEKVYLMDVLEKIMNMSDVYGKALLEKDFFAGSWPDDASASFFKDLYIKTVGCKMSTEDYFNDPDYERMRWEEKRKELEQFEQDTLRYQHEKAMAQNAQEQNQIFEDALKDAGLSREEYNQIAQLDPQFMKEAFTNHVRSLVRTVKDRPRDSKGRFVPMNQARQQSQSRQPWGQDVDRARIDALRAKGQKEGLSNENEINELLDAEIGKLF